MTYNGVSGGQYPYDINAGVMAKIASMPSLVVFLLILISIHRQFIGHIFSLSFRNFLLFTLGPGDRKNYADIH